MKVYIAGRLQDRERIAEIRKELEAAEIEVTADWITQATVPLPGDLAECRRDIEVDLRQIAEADVFVLFKPTSSHGDTTGGHHVETGYALALGKPVFLVGSAENLFHRHENVREFDSPQSVIHAILCFKPEDVKPEPRCADSYQRWTSMTALYPGKGEKKTFGVTYLAFGLGGEAGEAVDKIVRCLNAETERLLMSGDKTADETIRLTNLCEATQKLSQFSGISRVLEDLKRPLREAKMLLPDLSPLPEDAVAEIKKELGDVSWYLARMADELGIPLSQVMAANVEKLMSRRNRGTLHGAGDNR